MAVGAHQIGLRDLGTNLLHRGSFDQVRDVIDFVSQVVELHCLWMEAPTAIYAWSILEFVEPSTSSALPTVYSLYMASAPGAPIF
jgi:hypothetical protein